MDKRYLSLNYQETKEIIGEKIEIFVTILLQSDSFETDQRQQDI